MAGQAKYTNYAPVQKDISTGGASPPSMGKANYPLLNTLFGTRPDVIPFTNSPADLKPLMDRANLLLTPPKAEADPVWFPKGVYLNFQNPDPSLQAPDVPNINVGALGPGGPASPYFPNLTSTDTTGAGNTEPVQALVMGINEPDGTQDVVLGANNNTAVPSVTSLNMFLGNKLGENSLLPGFRPGRTLPEY